MSADNRTGAGLNPNREDDFSAADILGSGAFVDNARLTAVLFLSLEDGADEMARRVGAAPSLPPDDSPDEGGDA